MSFFSKKVEEKQVEVKIEKKQDLYPISHIADSLKDYQKKLVQKEVSSLEELREIHLSFDKVLEDNKIMQEKMDVFRERFQSVGQVVGQFDNVKLEIISSLDEAQQQANGLKQSSERVEAHFEEIQSTFSDFQVSVQEIKECMKKIVSIANQTIEATSNQYQSVLDHIEKANELGSTKSSMFEDMDNMLSQIGPLVKEYSKN